MIVYLTLVMILGVLGTILTPIGYVNNIFGNIIENSSLVALLRLASFVFDPGLITAIIDSLILWFSLFVLRPLINFIRNKK